MFKNMTLKLNFKMPSHGQLQIVVVIIMPCSPFGLQGGLSCIHAQQAVSTVHIPYMHTTAKYVCYSICTVIAMLHVNIRGGVCTDFHRLLHTRDCKKYTSDLIDSVQRHMLLSNLLANASQP